MTKVLTPLPRRPYNSGRNSHAPFDKRPWERRPSVSARPLNFHQFWAWGVREAEVSQDISSGVLIQRSESTPERRAGLPWARFTTRDVAGSEQTAAFAPKIHSFDMPKHRTPKGFVVHSDRGIPQTVGPRRIYDWETGVYRAPRNGEKPTAMSPYWEGGDTDDRGKHGAPPFTRAFEQHMSGRSRASSMRTIAGRLHRKPPKVQTLEYRILQSLLSGHTDPDVVCAILGWRRDMFEETASRVLSLVWAHSQERLAKAVAS